MSRKRSMFFIFTIIALSTCTVYLFGKTNGTNDYECIHLDRSNTQQVDQVRQLFANSPALSTSKHSSQDLEKWIGNSTYRFLLARNKDASICGCAVYFIFNHQEIFLQIMVLPTKHTWRSIAAQLLQQLEQTLCKLRITMYISQENGTWYKFLKKLGYGEKNEWITLCKSINKDSVSSNIDTSICTIRFLDRQNPEEIKLFSQLFFKDEVAGAWTPEEMQKFTTRTNYQFLVAFDTNNQPCAGLIYKTNYTTGWEITVFAVDKNYRRQGIATAMLQTIAQLALQNNIEQLTVHTFVIKLAAIACYKKQGFIEKEIFYELEKTLVC